MLVIDSPQGGHGSTVGVHGSNYIIFRILHMVPREREFGCKPRENHSMRNTRLIAF